MAEGTTRITDVTTLRAIANPVRFRLYELLTSRGASTATQLSEDMGMAPNALSYHLRQLAAHGFAEEVPSSGDKRERWWRAIPGGLRWRREDFAGSAAAAEVLQVAERLLVERQMDRLTAWLENGKAAWGEDWSSAASSADFLLWLTRDELDEMTAEVEELITRWVRASRGRKSEAENQGRVPVFSIFHAFPADDAPSTQGAASHHGPSTDE